MKKMMRKIAALTQKFPETSSLIVSSLLGLVIAILQYLDIMSCPTHKSAILVVIASLVIGLIMGAIYYLGSYLIFSSKKMEEARAAAVQSGITVMINQKLIENGSITSADQMIPL